MRLKLAVLVVAMVLSGLTLALKASPSQGITLESPSSSIKLPTPPRVNK
jgi:hypothetical protein